MVGQQPEPSSGPQHQGFTTPSGFAGTFQPTSRKRVLPSVTRSTRRLYTQYLLCTLMGLQGEGGPTDHTLWCMDAAPGSWSTTSYGSDFGAAWPTAPPLGEPAKGEKAPWLDNLAHPHSPFGRGSQNTRSGSSLSKVELTKYLARTRQAKPSSARVPEQGSGFDIR